jgi:hypothetical protein
MAFIMNFTGALGAGVAVGTDVGVAAGMGVEFAVGEGVSAHQAVKAANSAIARKVPHKKILDLLNIRTPPQEIAAFQRAGFEPRGIKPLTPHFHYFAVLFAPRRIKPLVFPLNLPKGVEKPLFQPSG